MYETERDKQIDKRNKEILKLYNYSIGLAKRPGELIKHIADLHDISGQQVRNILKEKGVKFRSKNNGKV